MHGQCTPEVKKLAERLMRRGVRTRDAAAASAFVAFSLLIDTQIRSEHQRDELEGAFPATADKTKYAREEQKRDRSKATRRTGLKPAKRPMNEGIYARCCVRISRGSGDGGTLRQAKLT